MAKVYLAGPIVGYTFKEATEWRNYLKAAFEGSGIVCYSPMRGSRYDDTDELIGPQGTNVCPINTNKGLTTRDRYDVMSSDLVFANLLKPKRAAIGTIIEIGWADAFRKPLVVAMEPDSIHDHGMINEMASFVVTSLAEGIEVIRGILLP
jgi:nucleoside 2-deoxyribosyltransferase